MAARQPFRDFLHDRKYLVWQCAAIAVAQHDLTGAVNIGCGRAFEGVMRIGLEAIK